jgi:hypothetical protein
VRSGQSVAVPQRQVIQNQWGTRVIDSSQYQEVSSGFYVLPRVNGDRVTLEISAQNDRSCGSGDQPAMRVQQASSTVSVASANGRSGRLGRQKTMTTDHFHAAHPGRASSTGADQGEEASVERWVKAKNGYWGAGILPAAG